MKYVEFDPARPLDLVLLGRVAIDTGYKSPCNSGPLLLAA